MNDQPVLELQQYVQQNCFLLIHLEKWKVPNQELLPNQEQIYVLQINTFASLCIVPKPTAPWLLLPAGPVNTWKSVVYFTKRSLYFSTSLFQVSLLYVSTQLLVQ